MNDILEKAKRHLRQLSPHVAARQAATILQELVDHLDKHPSVGGAGGIGTPTTLPGGGSGGLILSGCAVRAEIQKAEAEKYEIPLCGDHAASWFTERNHLKGGMNAKCVVCAHEPKAELRSRLTHTKTYTTTDIVIYQGPGTPMLIFAQDYSVKTPQEVEVYPEIIPHLVPQHLRRFWSMKDFTEWLFEVGAVVDKCHFVVIPSRDSGFC